MPALRPTLLATLLGVALSGLAYGTSSPVFVPSPALDAHAQLALERLNWHRADPAGRRGTYEAQLAAERLARPERCGPEPGILEGLSELEPRPPLALPTSPTDGTCSAWGR